METKSHNRFLYFAIGLGIVLNLAIGQMVIKFNSPVYLDAIGTVTLTLLCDWGIGAIAGVLSFLLGGLLSPHMPYFIFTQFTIALVAGISAKRGGFKTIPRLILTGIALGFIAAAVSAPAVSLAFGDTATFWASTDEYLKNIFVTKEVWIEPLDKTLQCLAAVFIVWILPKTMKARFNSPGSLLKANNLA